MKKLDRYVLRELIVPFLIGTLAVLLMFQANQLIYVLKTFPVHTIPIAATLKYILFKTPQYAQMTLPVGMSLAAALAISRLQRETELTAMRVAGAAIMRVVLPVTIFGLFVGLLNLYITEQVMPKSEREARNLLMQVGIMGDLPEFKSNVTVNLRNYAANFGAVTRNSDGSMSLSQIILFERPRGDVTQITSAQSGEYRDGVWTLHDTNMFQLRGVNLVAMKPGKDVVINERVTIEDMFTAPISEEQSASELKKAITEGKKAGRDTTSLEVDYHTRFSVPASCIVFALVAPVFAVWFARSGGFIGVLLSIFLVFLYYNAYVISTAVLGKNGIVSPFLAAWLPNILFVVLGAVAIRRLE